MLKPMYARHVLVTICVFAVITVLCVGTSHFVEDSARRHLFNEQATALINQIQAHGGDQEAYVQELNQANEKMHMPLSIDLLDANVEPAHGPPSLSVVIKTASGEKTLRVSMHPHGPPPAFAHGPPGGPGPFRGPPPMFFGPSLVTIASLLFAILLASALSVFFIYRSFREKAEMAREVLGRMQRGDLKARFTISNRDEARQMFELFNQMAAEIERLVERLREDERTRVQLLQELAHDLRTPVSSLKNAIETIRFDEDKLDAATKTEIKELAFQETEYLSRLVDDLLFLALVLEPKYKTESSEVTLSELISSQMHAATSNHPHVTPVFDEEASAGLHITGSTQLLRRLFRNAFENAFSFAQASVTTTVEQTADGIRILIQDDGPGLSPEALVDFGKKKSFTRYRAAVSGGRPSVGLGSVILKTIAAAHGGDVSIRNRIDQSGKLCGAELTIFLATSIKIAV